MRSKLGSIAAVIALLLILGGQMSDLFDRSDDTLKTGSDVDYSVVLIVAASVAVVIVPTGFALAPAIRRAKAMILEAPRLDCWTSPKVRVELPGSSPPLLPLRI